MNELRKKIARKVAQFEAAKEQCKTDRKASVEKTDEVYAIEEAQDIAQQVAQLIQNQAHAKIATIVSQCLEAVFAEPYEFCINFVRKRGRTEAGLMFKRDGLAVDPLTASGGGVVCIAAFALRIAALVLSRPAMRRLLVLDEPFSHLSRDLRPRVRTLLESIARDTGVQIIMVTHDTALQTGTLINL